MKPFLLILIIASTLALDLPSTFNIKANSCNFWKKTGEWTDDITTYIEWGQKCTSTSPSDITLEHNGNKIGSTDQKQLTIGTKIKIKDENNNVVAIIKENVFSGFGNIYTEYTLTDKDNNIYATSEKIELFDTQFSIFDNNNNLIATASRDYLNVLAESFCQDGVWYINFNTNSNHFLNQPSNRWIIASMINVKAVRDIDRDDQGNVKKSPCQNWFWFLVLGLPILFIMIVVGTIIIIMRKFSS